MRWILFVGAGALVAACGVETYSMDHGADWVTRRSGAGGGGAVGGGFGGGMFGGDGGGCVSGSGADPGKLVDPAETTDALPVTGSTLFVSRSSDFAIAVNPDAPSVSFLHLGNGTAPADPNLNVDFPLNAGEWPFKPVEDSRGNVYVLLRGTGQLLALDRTRPAVQRRTALCAQPRGLAVDPSSDALYVACAEGEVLTVRGSDGAVLARKPAPNDLRDVLVRDGVVYASRFRSAQFAPVGGVFEGTSASLITGLTSTVAWKTVATSTGALMLHQTSSTANISTFCSGYGGSSGAGKIVTSTLSRFSVASDGGVTAQALSFCVRGSFAVDLAVSPDERVVAIAEAGMRAVTLAVPGSASACSDVIPLLKPEGGFRPVGVAFAQDGRLVVQTEEPAVHVYAPVPVQLTTTLPGPGGELLKYALPGGPLQNTGHRLFHDATAGGMSCASCHPEGLDDGHVWTFSSIGARRTQSLGGGIAQTAPFHWDGDMTTFSTLVSQVMSLRMTGPNLDAPRQSALLSWIDSIPAARVPAKDANAAARGKALFESAAAGCASCHSGSAFTNNSSANVGTGGTFQVPTLIGLGTRAPFMHNGCAKTLRDRFGACGGGDAHGKTSQLSAAELDDLTAYLASL